MALQQWLPPGLQQWQPPTPGWGVPGQSPATPFPHQLTQQGRLRDRLRRQAVIGLCLAVAGWYTGLTSSRAGWLAIGLGWLLVALIGAHRGGGLRWLARIVCEYAVVALLVALVVIATGVRPHPAPPQPATRAGATGQLCPTVVRNAAGAFCDQLERLHDKLTAPQPAPTTTTHRPTR